MKDKIYMDIINMYNFHYPNHHHQHPLHFCNPLKEEEMTEPVAVVVAELTEEQQSV